MEVSVVVCTHRMERYGVFADCLRSVLAQTYDPLEVVVVVDGDDAVYERACAEFGDCEDVSIHRNRETRGVSYSRTRGAELASGEVVAFIDDDAVAEPDWIAELARVYREGTVAVGGRVVPEWVEEKPDFFPSEFYWLVGCDERGMGKHMEELRNTYGSNISFRREAFLAAGGYDEHTGRKGDHHIQAHEAPVCARLKEATGRGVVYNTHSVVHHRLFPYRGDFWWLLARSFWQGYSKRVMDFIIPAAGGDEREYLKRLFGRYVPGRLRRLVASPSFQEATQLGAILAFTAAVFVGYLYGLVAVREGDVEGQTPRNSRE